ncbi:MAG: glycoside hydrolase family protein [Proteobacteria bacterium]|nr:glycoside hydrolase family protein [Pseudomonadota bacterium]MCH9735805.1 glycoside hydrolase family protein [Actinomycetes bacterium]
MYKHCYKVILIILLKVSLLADPSIAPEAGAVKTLVSGSDEKGLTKGKKHLVNREGYRDVSYKDTQGNLTGGTGHLLTENEKKLYPEGTKIPKSVTDKWFKEDSAKARESGNNQAKDLGITSEDFKDALMSVNFQLGGNWKKIHKKTWEALEKKDYKGAIAEIKKSTWHKQTPKRSNDFIKAISKLK